MPERIGLAQLDYAALQAEIAHETMRITLAAHTKPGTDLPPELRIPRALKPGMAEPIEESAPRRGVSLIEAMGMAERMFNG